MNRNKPYIGMANEGLIFDKINKPRLIFFLNPIVVFILVALVGIEDGLAKSRSVVRSQLNQQKSSRSLFIAKYKQLSSRQKLQLYSVMIRTMAVLEHSYYKSSGKARSAFRFLDLWLVRAYAQNSSEVCFYGGHVVRGCNWSQARRQHSSCRINGVRGVQCNSNILLNEGICVYTIGHAKRQGLRNYSTTQACVYADTQITAQRLAGTNPAHTSDQVVRDQLNNQLWGSGDPDVWHSKRDKIITEALGADGLTEYREHVNSRLGDGNELHSQLTAIDRACKNVRNPFEIKHCQFFRRELNELGLNQRPTPRPRRKEPAPITTTTTTTPIVEAPSPPQECDKLSHCSEDEIKERHVCIIESGMHMLVGRSLEYSNNYVATYNCPNQEGVDTLTYFVAEEDQDDVNGILEQLSDVAQRCTKIKRLYLSGHGVPGSLANGLNRDNVNHLSDYSCLMADNPIVDLAGCSAGKGCSGKLFMQKTAEALFHNTTGTVIAPNVDTWFTTGIGSFTDEHLAYNSLTFTPPPPSPPQATWKKIGNRERISYQKGIMEGIIQEEQPDEHATIEDQCIDDMSEMVDLIHSNEELHRSRGTCEPLIGCPRQPYAGIISSSKRHIRSLENTRFRNRYTHRSFLNLVANNYDNLKRIDEKLFQCDRTCTVRDRRAQCTKVEYIRGHTQRTGCHSSDYFLPYSSGPVRSLIRDSSSEVR